MLWFFPNLQYLTIYVTFVLCLHWVFVVKRARHIVDISSVTLLKNPFLWLWLNLSKFSHFHRELSGKRTVDMLVSCVLLFWVIAWTLGIKREGCTVSIKFVYSGHWFMIEAEENVHKYCINLKTDDNNIFWEFCCLRSYEMKLSACKPSLA